MSECSWAAKVEHLETGEPQIIGFRFACFAPEELALKLLQENMPAHKVLEVTTNYWKFKRVKPARYTVQCLNKETGKPAELQVVCYEQESPSDKIPNSYQLVSCKENVNE